MRFIIVALALMAMFSTASAVSSCDTHTCPENAYCEFLNNEPWCKCNDGYSGHGNVYCAISDPNSLHYVVKPMQSSTTCTETDGNCETKAVSDTEIYAFRCCSDTGMNLFTKTSGCNVYHESDYWTRQLYMNRNCQTGTWDDANTWCQSEQARLCTKEEVENECVLGSGCSYDQRLIWTADEAQSYFIVKGKPSDLRCDEDDGDCSFRTSHVEEEYSIRCCSDTEIDGWTKIDGCNVWNESDNWSDGQGCLSLNFEDAKQFCIDQGARLCSSSEVLSDCVRKSGCGFDRNMIWTSSDPTTYETFHYVRKGRRNNGSCQQYDGDCATQAVANDKRYAVRCCSDSEISGWTQYENCPIWIGVDTDTCLMSASWDEANAFCTNLGARLCTLADIDTDCTKDLDTGCVLDAMLIWTSDEADGELPDDYWVPVDTYHYVVKGDPNSSECDASEGCTTKLASDANARWLRCCSDTQVSSEFTQQNGCNVWATSTPGGSCRNKKMWSAAEEICVSVGARLCTKTEMENGCAASTGCDLDTQLIWTSTDENGADSSSAVDIEVGSMKIKAISSNSIFDRDFAKGFVLALSLTVLLIVVKENYVDAKRLKEYNLLEQDQLEI